METSSTEIIETEKYLQDRLDHGRSLIFQARLLVDEELRRNALFHAMVHRLVKLYHRKQLKAEVAAAHRKLFHDNTKPDFRENILRIFNA